jgi:tetratricopeptide (TPR) repeat protein
VYRVLGFAYHNFGDFEKAELYCKKAISQSGTSMLSIQASSDLSNIYLQWGKADSAIKYAERYLNDSSVAYYQIAEAYCNLKNDCATAADLYEKAWRQSPNRTNPHRWAVALMNIGKVAEAKEKIQMAFKEYRDGRRHDTLSYDYAGICALNGEKEKALQILKQWKWEWGSPYLVQHDKLFDNIRNEAEFKELVKKALDEKTKLRNRIKKMEENGDL